jgi:hypothetical protein
MSAYKWGARAARLEPGDSASVLRPPRRAQAARPRARQVRAHAQRAHAPGRRGRRVRLHGQRRGRGGRARRVPAPQRDRGRRARAQGQPAAPGAAGAAGQRAGAARDAGACIQANVCWLLWHCSGPAAISRFRGRAGLLLHSSVVPGAYWWRAPVRPARSAGPQGHWTAGW